MTQRSPDVYLNQLKELTLSEWKLREQSSVTGFLWTLLNPALTFGVLYWLFTQWLHGTVPNYAEKLVIGVVQYGFLNAGTTYGLSSLSRRRGIMMNFTLPRELLVLSSVLSVSLSYLIEFALMLGFIVLLGVRPSWSWAALPPLIAASIVLVCALSLALAVLAVRFPDFERIWTIVITMGFFVTPVFYTLDSVSAERRRLIGYNPAARLIEAMRACVLGTGVPAPRHWAVLAAGCVAVALGCYALFKSQERLLGDFVLC